MRVIEPGDVPGFVVFADCLSDALTVKARKIRKGSPVSVKGKLQSFGASAVCLSDCRLMRINTNKYARADALFRKCVTKKRETS
jgi:hypothetical protein